MPTLEHAPRSAPRSASLRLMAPVLVCLVVQVPLTVLGSARSPSAAGSGLAVILLVLAIAGPVLLLAASRAPGPVSAALAVFAALDTVLRSEVSPSPIPLYAALFFGIALAIARGAAIWVLVTAPTVWLGTALVAFGAHLELQPPRVVIVTALALVAVAAGAFRRRRRETMAARARAAEERRERAEQAERVRIARELHDVLAHSLSQISVQAGMGLHLGEAQPERAREALGNIRRTSVTALDEVRAVIGALRGSGEAPLAPQTDLSHLPALAAGFEEQGLRVLLRADDVDAPLAVQTSLYRIAQEALTNVLRHAGASTVEVSVRADGDGIELRVVDDGRGAVPGFAEHGNGLLGMRERAALLAGSVEAGPVPGGFAVIARLPLGGRA